MTEERKVDLALDGIVHNIVSDFNIFVHNNYPFIQSGSYAGLFVLSVQNNMLKFVHCYKKCKFAFFLLTNVNLHAIIYL